MKDKVITLRDLFLKEKSYIIEIDINDKYYLYCEGIDEFGCVISKDFNIENIEHFCLELFEKINNMGEYIETIDNYGITLNESINDLLEKTRNLLGE